MYNVPAAWRSGGVSISNYAVQRDVFYLPAVSAETCSHCAKPQVSSSVLYLLRFLRLRLVTHKVKILGITKHSAKIQKIYQKTTISFFFVSLRNQRLEIMNTTFHFTSAQEVSPAILEEIRKTYREQPISIYVETNEPTMSDWEMQELKRREQIFLEPDNDLRNAITAEELLVGIHEDIRKKFASRV